MTTIFMVNLMIAKMTSTYESIRSKSLHWRALQRCEFAIEFKDERLTPPPFNLVNYFNPWSWWYYCKRRHTHDLQHDAQRGFSVLMGADATLRLQTHERRHAQSFDKNSRQYETEQTESRVAAIMEDMPTIRSLARRCLGLEEASRSLADGFDPRITLRTDTPLRCNAQCPLSAWHCLCTAWRCVHCVALCALCRS
jgi:hypothetical protein